MHRPIQYVRRCGLQPSALGGQPGGPRGKGPTGARSQMWGFHLMVEVPSQPLTPGTAVAVPLGGAAAPRKPLCPAKAACPRLLSTRDRPCSSSTARQTGKTFAAERSALQPSVGAQPGGVTDVRPVVPPPRQPSPRTDGRSVPIEPQPPPRPGTRPPSASVSVAGTPRPSQRGGRTASVLQRLTGCTERSVLQARPRRGGISWWAAGAPPGSARPFSGRRAPRSFPCWPS